MERLLLYHHLDGSSKYDDERLIQRSKKDQNSKQFTSFSVEERVTHTSPSTS